MPTWDGPALDSALAYRYLAGAPAIWELWRGNQGSTLVAVAALLREPAQSTTEQAFGSQLVHRAPTKSC